MVNRRSAYLAAGAGVPARVKFHVTDSMKYLLDRTVGILAYEVTVYGAIKPDILVEEIIRRDLQQQGIVLQEFLAEPAIQKHDIGIVVKDTGLLPQVDVSVGMHLEFKRQEEIARSDRYHSSNNRWLPRC